MEIEIKSFLANAGTTEAVAGAVVLAVFLQFLRTMLLSPGTDVSQIPLAGEELGSRSKRIAEYESTTGNCKAMYRTAYAKYKSMFRVQTKDGDQVLLPPKYYDEIKRKGEDEVDNLAALDILTQKKYTNIDSSSSMMTHLVKADLTMSLNRINPRLGISAEETVESEMPACKDWTPINVNDALVRIIAIVSGYIFLGPEICRNEEYIAFSTGYTVDAMTCSAIVTALPAWARRVGVFFIPHYYRVEGYKKRVRKFMAPIIQERRAAAGRENYEKPDDLLQWTIDKAPEWPEMRSDDDIAVMQLRLSLAAIHTTSTTATAILYDLVSLPGLVEELRKEIEEVIAKHDGVITNKALYDMKLLDSVMKESQRTNPLSLVSLFRMSGSKGVTFADGAYVPPGMFLATPVEAVQRDPTFYEDPDTFDPHRFSNMRKKENEAAQHQFVTLGREVLSFGLGKHACPGRFFAANEIKLILINLLRKFDVKQKDEGPRYQNIAYGLHNSPDPTRELLFKRAAT